MEAGVEVLEGVKVMGVDVEGTAVLLGDGTSVSAHLSLGADGVHVSVSLFLS